MGAVVRRAGFVLLCALAAIGGVALYDALAQGAGAGVLAPRMSPAALSPTVAAVPSGPPMIDGYSADAWRCAAQAVERTVNRSQPLRDLAAMCEGLRQSTP